MTEASGGALDGTTGTLTAAGLAAFPELKGPIPFDTGSYGYGATVTAGAPYTPFLTNTAGQAMAGVYQHPNGDPQAGVSELALNFDYNATQLQWLLLAPGLINWVTQDTHLGLYRNYFGQDIDDLFIADNEWSSAVPVHPRGDRTRPTSPARAGVAQQPGGHPAGRADERGRRGVRGRLGAADRDQAEPGLQRASGRAPPTLPRTSRPPTAPAASPITGSPTPTPARSWTPAPPTTPAFVNALLADQGSFNWITHTWSHLFLGCPSGSRRPSPR